MYTVEISFLEELMSFIKKYGNVVILSKSLDCDLQTIEIYDSWRSRTLKKVYKVYVKGKLMKEYDSPLQAYIWLQMKGYIWQGKGYLFLSKDCKVIIEEDK